MDGAETVTHSRDEGVSIVLVALMLTFLLGMAAFGVDIALANSEATRVQRAADAAALSGVVFMPSGLADATAAATQTAAANGYPASQVTVEAISGRSDRVRVTIRDTVGLNFGSFLGTDSIDLERHAVAEYNGPIPMGSPVNGLGNEPQLSCTGPAYPTPEAVAACTARDQGTWVGSAGQGQYWLHLAGRNRPKHNGDAFQSANCDTPRDSNGNPNGPVPDSCNNSNTGPNDDYRDEGYIYLVDNQNIGGTLNIQMFDPAFVEVGDQCLELPPDLGLLLAPRVADAPSRYARGAASPFCTGDADDVNNLITTVVIRSPDATPWNNTDNPVVCQTQFGAFQSPPPPNPPTTNPRTQNEPWRENNPSAWNTANSAIFRRLDPANARYNDRLLGSYTWTLAQTFRRWVSPCPAIANAEQGRYVVQILTNRRESINPLGEAPTSSDVRGGNRFSIRVARDGTNASGLSVFAAGRLGIYTNAGGANTSFYLARVPSSNAGKELVLRFYDTGDSTRAGSLQILGPNGTITGCSYEGPSAAETAAIAGSCTATGLLASNGFNGRWMTLRYRLPSNYSCADNVASSCWFRVLFSYPDGVPSDTTSWSASLGGDPVRLIE
jgi:hypothetical protein